MASIDAFYSVPIHKDYQKYLRCQWVEDICKLLGMPNRYSEVMRIFTKVLKPAFFCFVKTRVAVGHVC